MSIWRPQESTKPVIPGLGTPEPKAFNAPRTTVKDERGPRIAYLVGSELLDRLELDLSIHIPMMGSTDVNSLRVTDPGDFSRIHVTKNYFRQPFRYKLGKHDVFLNLVTDADQHPKVLGTMARMLEGVRGRVINRPEAVLASTRDQVAARLGGLAGAHIPKVLRLRTAKPDLVRAAIAAANLRFPLIARPAGTHSGEIHGLFETIDLLLPKLQPNTEHYLSEFVDFRSADGLYRKYRVFFLGDRWFLRHMIVSDHWNIHMADRERFMLSRAAVREEEARVLRNPAERFGPQVLDALRAIKAELGLDYFGVDFGILQDGRLLLFEANAVMNVFPFSDRPEFRYVEACLPQLQQAFEQMLGLDRKPRFKLKPPA